MSACVSMGTTPSSRYAQGYVTEFCNNFQDKFHTAHLDLYDEWAAGCPAGRVRVRRHARRNPAYIQCSRLLHTRSGSSTVSVESSVAGARVVPVAMVFKVVVRGIVNVVAAVSGYWSFPHGVEHVVSQEKLIRG